ncbi:MAG: penicillin-binding Tp47 domain C-containing protein [Lachnospiraceae bacterium]
MLLPIHLPLVHARLEQIAKIADTAQLTASDIEMTVKPADGAYGEFLRVDFNGNGYGALGSRMQAVKWTYYGNDSSTASRYRHMVLNLLSVPTGI